MQPSRIHHVGLPVTDLDISVAWYREALGLTHESTAGVPEVSPSWSRRPASCSSGSPALCLGRADRVLSRFRGRWGLDRLPAFATAGLHNGSILSGRAAIPLIVICQCAVWRGG